VVSADASYTVGIGLVGNGVTAFGVQVRYTIL
jgi:hypothetical protein